MNMLSNDNGFLNDLNLDNPFQQRTLLSRVFNSENNTVFVPKPIFTFMTMLSFLGEEKLSDDQGKDLHVLSTISTTSGYQAVSILISNIGRFKGEIVVELKNLNHLPISNPVLIERKLYQKSTNPMRAWKKMGSPKVLTDEQIKVLLVKSNLERSKVKNYFPNSPIKLRFKGSPEIKLVQLCFAQHLQRISQPHRIQFHLMSSTQLLITWRFIQSPTCLSSFQVEHSPDGTKFRKINTWLESLNRFHNHFVSDNETLTGWYRVSAFDLWNVEGPKSIPVYFKPEF